ncbi:MAG: hypothetical protein PUC65_06550 [Clostridiales bacterium]|nr:hypothetical protein [Clostridiales bacterium]
MDKEIGKLTVYFEEPLVRNQRFMGQMMPWCFTVESSTTEKNSQVK